MIYLRLHAHTKIFFQAMVTSRPPRTLVGTLLMELNFIVYKYAAFD